MTSHTISTKLRILAPDDGMALTDGTTYTTGTVYLAWDADVSRWREVPESEIPPPPDPVPAPRRWSRLSIKGALADAHMLPAAKEFLSAFEVKPDYSAWEALTDCDYIEEFYGGDERWNALLNGAAQALGKTRAEIDAFLDAIPQEGGA